ncbi:keratin-associated protein 21-1-like [Pristis pectinata]|uniref:keratin-associated protein 21-1-like n=1 Tax=Pristis pectinata TaxID=685728 RepID=UPI00223D39B5|nr:keratin-associated protein 21-1-like [Pristis pectinata]
MERQAAVKEPSLTVLLLLFCVLVIAGYGPDYGYVYGPGYGYARQSLHCFWTRSVTSLTHLMGPTHPQRPTGDLSASAVGYGNGEMDGYGPAYGYVYGPGYGYDGNGSGQDDGYATNYGYVGYVSKKKDGHSAGSGSPCQKDRDCENGEVCCKGKCMDKYY